MSITDELVMTICSRSDADRLALLAYFCGRSPAAVLDALKALDDEIAKSAGGAS